MRLNKLITAVLVSSVLAVPGAIAPEAAADLLQPSGITVQDGRQVAKELTTEQRHSIE